MNPLEDKFKQFGQAVQQCAPQLVELIKEEGDEVYFSNSSKGFSALSNFDLILGNVAEGYSASSLLMELSRLLARQDATKRLAPDVDEWIAKSELRINQLNNALVDNKTEDYNSRLSDLRELVLIMREGLVNEALSLEISLNTKFGYVDSIKDKQAENKYLISRITRLTEKLMLLDFKKLRNMAGDNADLLGLLISRLHTTIESCRLSLNTSLPRLKHLLWEFEKRKQDEELIWLVYDRLVNQSQAYTHIPSDSQIENLNLNIQNEASPIKALPDINDNTSKDSFSELVSLMKAPDYVSHKESLINVPRVEFEQSEKTESLAIHSAMERHLFSIIKMAKEEPVSCLRYWEENVKEQEYPAGFMQWVHNTLIESEAVNIKILDGTPNSSSWSDNKNIFDLILDCRDAI